MPLTSLHPPFRADQASACECLGPEAPLARVLARVTAAIDQLAAAMVVICVAAVWLAVGGPRGAEVIGAAVATTFGLGCRAGALISERNELMLDLIARGEEHPSLLVFARMRQRLLDPGSRRRLVVTIRSICATSARALGAGGVPVNARVIHAVERELEEVLGALAAERVGAAGAARALRLVTGPGSPLYGDDVLALREELNRIRYLLQATS